MKKRVWIIVCMLMMALETFAMAEVDFTEAQMQDFLSQYSIEELLQLKALVDEELAHRGYAAEASSTYIINKNTQKFHHPTCSSVNQMKEKNRGTYEGGRDALISLGFSPCGNCDP